MRTPPTLKVRILNLLLVFALMAAAAIGVNKTLFGHTVIKEESERTETASPVEETIIHTADLDDVATGYGGPVNFDIRIADGKIVSIEPLPNSETPSFFGRVLPLLDSWIGKTPGEALATKVDAVSGATYSSEAVIHNVSAGLAYYEGSHVENRAEVPLKIWISLVVVLFACIVPLFVRNKVYHRIQMVANIVVLGFWAGQFLDYRNMLNSLSFGILLPGGAVMIAMLAAAFIYPLFGRPQHYCNHICPLGSAQQLAGSVCRYKINLSAKTLKVLEWFRRILWVVLMLSLWFDCLTEWLDYELFQAFLVESSSVWMMVVAGTFIALSAVVGRPYCRFVCPTGSLFKLIG